jgi:hypothetical protein
MFQIKKLEKEEVSKILPTLEKIANSSKYTAGFKPKDLHKIFVAYLKDKIVAYGGVTCYHGFWGLRSCAVDSKYRSSKTSYSRTSSLSN